MDYIHTPSEASLAHCWALHGNNGFGKDFEAAERAITKIKAAAWEAGCKKGLGTNPGWEDEALAQNPYKEDQ